MRILIVEDDPMVTMITTRFLEQIDSGSTVSGAENIEAAHRLCRELEFDLMLVDVYFPDGSGIDFLRQERKHNNPAAAIMITADRDPATVEQAFSLGAVDYLIKPFEFERFHKSINDVESRIVALKARSGERLDQASIDRWLGTPNSGAPALLDEELPAKGLGKQTYALVKESILAKSGDFSAQEIAEEAGLARVTVRRYLERMVAEGLLRCTPIYGQVGRPVHRYSLNPGRRTRGPHAE